MVQTFSSAHYLQSGFKDMWASEGMLGKPD